MILYFRIHQLLLENSLRQQNASEKEINEIFGFLRGVGPSKGKLSTATSGGGGGTSGGLLKRVWGGKDDFIHNYNIQIDRSNALRKARGQPLLKYWGGKEAAPDTKPDTTPPERQKKLKKRDRSAEVDALPGEDDFFENTHYGNIAKLIRESFQLNEKKKGPCWKGYKSKGMKKKNGRMVPNCVPVSESIERIGQLLTEKLCVKGKAAAKRKYDVYPSAYANMYASAVCSGKVKSKGKKK